MLMQERNSVQCNAAKLLYLMQIVPECPPRSLQRLLLHNIQANSKARASKHGRVRNPSGYTQCRLGIQGSVTTSPIRIALLAVQCRVLLKFANSSLLLGEYYCYIRLLGTRVWPAYSKALILIPHCYTRVCMHMPITSSSCSGVRGGQPILAGLGMAGESGGLSNRAATLAHWQYQTQETLYQALSHFQWLGEYYLQCFPVAYAYCPDKQSQSCHNLFKRRRLGNNCLPLN